MSTSRAQRVRHAEVPLRRSPSGLPTQYLAWRETGSTQLFVGQQWLGQGQRVFLHTHPVEEVLMFLAGRGTATLDGEAIEIAAGDSLIIPAGVVHGFRNDEPESLHVLVIFPGDDFARTDLVEPAHDQSALHPSSLPGLPPETYERHLSIFREREGGEQEPGR